MPYANNKGADQTAHLRSLISTFVVHCLDSIIPLVSIFEILSLYLVSLTAQTGLSLPWSQTPKTRSLVMWLLLFKWCWHKIESLRTGDEDTYPNTIKLISLDVFWTILILGGRSISVIPINVQASMVESNWLWNKLSRAVQLYVRILKTHLIVYLKFCFFICSIRIYIIQPLHLYNIS